MQAYSETASRIGVFAGRGNSLDEIGSDAGLSRDVDPLYLVARSWQWRALGDSGAGWELVQNLHHSNPNTKSLAADLFAKTPHSGMPSRQDKKRQDSNGGKLHVFSGKAGNMNSPYGLEISDSCLSCKLRKNSWFCGLSEETLRALNNVSHLSTYPSGALLFVEGQAPRGVYILCSGRVKLSTSSRDGKILMLKLAEPGSVLGLSAVIAGEPFELSAETAVPCQVNFVERDALLRLMEKSGELGMRATQMLSREFQTAYRDMQDLVLARSSAGKLARLLLSWTPGREPSSPKEVRIRSNATHEEMAQMIGASRETVTRLLGDLKKKDLIRLEGATLVIQNRGALEQIAA